MNKNLGLSDRVLRFFLGLILITLGFNTFHNTILRMLLILIGIIIFIESFVSYCYLYKLLGINTYKKEEK